MIIVPFKFSLEIDGHATFIHFIEGDVANDDVLTDKVF
jgi:hypothetical protein